MKAYELTELLAKIAKADLTDGAELGDHPAMLAIGEIEGQQSRIDQLEAHNRALLELVEIIQKDLKMRSIDGVVDISNFIWERIDKALSNSPDVSLYHKEQEVIEAADDIRRLEGSDFQSKYDYCEARDRAIKVVKEAVYNLQQTRKGQE